MTLIMIDEEQQARSVERVPRGEATLERPLRDLIAEHPALLPWTEPVEAEQRRWLARTANQFVKSVRPRLLAQMGALAA